MRRARYVSTVLGAHRELQVAYESQCRRLDAMVAELERTYASRIGFWRKA